MILKEPVVILNIFCLDCSKLCDKIIIIIHDIPHKMKYLNIHVVIPMSNYIVKFSLTKTGSVQRIASPIARQQICIGGTFNALTKLDLTTDLLILR